MPVNKVIYAGKTLIDLTSSTVTADTLLEGVTAYNSAGELIVGIYKPLSVLMLYASFSAGAWVEDTSSDSRWYQTINHEDILETDDPIIDLNLDGLTEDEEDAICKAWQHLITIVTGDGTLTAYTNSVPTVDIPIKIKEVR